MTKKTGTSTGRRTHLYSFTLIFTSIICWVMFVMSAIGQTSRGSISGTVTDSAEAVIAGAKIELVNKQTGVARSTVSNESGLYRFEAVDLGIYDVRVNQSGFKQFLTPGLEITANRTITLNAKLEVGSTQEVVEISASDVELLTKDSAQRGGSLSEKKITDLPLSGLEPISLARILPGVTQASGSRTFGNGGQDTQFAINGQRPRGNNYMLDGVDNNDLSVGGNAQSFNIQDAVKEVSVQTSNFAAEFGRAGGGVVNVIGKNGTNAFHGTALWQHRSSALNALDAYDKFNGAEKASSHENIFSGTIGGPIIRDKTHFFGAFQYDSAPGSRIDTFVLPTEAAITKLKSLFPNNPRLTTYLNALGTYRGQTNPFAVNLGDGRGTVDFGTASVNVISPYKDTQWTARIDHSFSDKHQLSGRYLFDDSIQPNASLTFPGYGYDYGGRSQNFLLSDTFTFSSTLTNELRVSYGRINFGFDLLAAGADNIGTLPFYSITDISAPGEATNMPQSRTGNSWTVQETQTKIKGTHTFRYGGELVRQLVKTAIPFNSRGSYSITNSANGAYSAFVNYLENYSGMSGILDRAFGDPILYPNAFRQSYFFQDNWKVSQALSLSLGLRYENYGQPFNVLAYPGYSGNDVSSLLTRTEVKSDNNNFAPTIGLAWSPSFTDGFKGKLFGDRKTVVRAGFQISYDSAFNNMLVNAGATAPNVSTYNLTGPAASRGTANFDSYFPTSGTVSARSPQVSVIDPNLVNPYTERWSFGLQRELAKKVMLDVSYVGNQSHKLYVVEDLNYLLNGTRLYSDLGIRRVRTNGGHSNYHALQAMLDHNMRGGLDLKASYTFSKYIDNSSELFEGYSNTSRYSSMAPALGGLDLDRGLSDYHRKHRFTVAYGWNLPGFKNGLLSYPLGGWKVTGITTFQSGLPFTVSNGTDRNGDGIIGNDRADIGNPNAPINTRGIISSSCITGYKNPDTGACVNKTDVYWVQASGLPNESTVGRNTLFTDGVKNFDMTFMKSFRILEGKTLEYRVEAFNIFNTSQLTNAPVARVNAPAGQFLNEYYPYNTSATASNRTMRMQLKFIF